MLQLSQFPFRGQTRSQSINQIKHPKLNSKKNKNNFSNNY